MRFYFILCYSWGLFQSCVVFHDLYCHSAIKLQLSTHNEDRPASNHTQHTQQTIRIGCRRWNAESNVPSSWTQPCCGGLGESFPLGQSVCAARVPPQSQLDFQRLYLRPSISSAPCVYVVSVARFIRLESTHTLCFLAAIVVHTRTTSLYMGRIPPC